MAYDYSKEKNEIMKQVPKNDRGDYIRVTKVTKPDGDVQMDIRVYYTSQSDMETVLPGRQGLRIPSDCVVDVACALVKGMTDLERQMFLEKVADSLGVELEPADEDDDDSDIDDDPDDLEGDSDEDELDD